MEGGAGPFQAVPYSRPVLMASGRCENRQPGVACWQAGDLQRSAGEICTAESAGGGRRAGVGMRRLGKQGEHGMEGKLAS